MFPEEVTGGYRCWEVLHFYEEPLVPVLRNKLEGSGFSSSKKTKISVSVLIPVLKIRPGSGPISGNLDQ
jgi:hypothetical protein